MGTKSSAVDAYITKAKPFARPILQHLRKLVHQTVPEAGEAIKWGMPFFVHAGENLCSMAAFNEHAAFGFWKAHMMKDPKKILAGHERSAMGQLGRLTSTEDLPADAVLISYLKQAAKLNEDGVKWTPAPEEKKPASVPPYLKKALTGNAAAKKAFGAFTPAQRRDYVEWLEEAKTEATRERRLATALEWMAEGKTRNWKYQKR
jgi:uncharacterized protein YdeI (YjbR/CyaY-like superfamily)